MKPKISVVMPAQNAGQTIANAIMSIRNQSFKDWELVIVDDGSTDNTVEVVKYFQLQDKRIRLIENLEPMGIPFTRNRGSAEAKAEILIVQDADDLSLPDRLERVYPLIKKYDVVIQGCYVNMWDAHFNCITREYRHAYPLEIKQLLRNQYLPGYPAYKKKVWEQKPFREETRYAYDWMMLLDWALSGYKFYSLDLGLYEYVRHSNSASIRFEKEGKRAEAIQHIKQIVKNEYAQNIRYNASLQPRGYRQALH